MTSRTRTRGLVRCGGTGLVLWVLAAVLPVQAQRPGLRLRLEPTYLQPYGHDPHVLTIHEASLGSTVDHKTAVTLDTQAGFAYLADVRYTKGRWSWGAGFFWFDTKQETPNRSQAGAGAGSEVTFEVADRRFTSANPGSVLYYRVLEDTEFALWTLDLFGERTLAESPGGRLALQLGVRFGDFDNDYRAVAGIEGTNGVRFDASSNYPRMTGPLVGLTGTVSHGRTSLEGYLGQSLIMGQSALEVRSREYTGPSESPVYFAEELFSTPQDVAIPITEVRIRGTWALLDQVALGVGLQASSWWDVGVPPGIAPIPGGDQVLLENTLVFFGLLGVLEIRF